MATSVLASSGALLSQILERLCINLQLSPDQLAKATQSYGAVTEWLAVEGSPVNRYFPSLSPQGSWAIDATVRPIHQNECDLDVVCRLLMPRACTPEEIYELVWERMYDHGTYRRIMERKERCIRLNYAESSQFHLDIVPAVADPAKGGTCILIPDLVDDEMEWKTSNPKGFLVWFESRKVALFEKYARAEIEPLRRPLPADQKAVLTKAVQILKRWRDVKWKDEPSLATPSIVLTYLAADYYAGESLLTDALSTILAGIEQFMRSGVREIVSPANRSHPAEIISEKWLHNPHCYESFADAIVGLRDEWNNLLHSKRGPALSDMLKELFGEPITQAIKEISEPVTLARTNGSLYVEKKTGMLLTAAPATSAMTAVRVKPNTHFGN